MISKIRSENPGRRFLKEVFAINTEYRKVKMGSQKTVGFTATAKTESAKRKVMFLLFNKISFTAINERTITAKSGDGDWEKSRSSGKNSRKSHDCFSKM